MNARQTTTTHQAKAAIVVVSLAFLAGCGGSPFAPMVVSSDGSAPSVASIGITPAVVQIDQIGASVTLEADAFDSDGNRITVPVTWDSQDLSVATISSDGIVTAVGEGETQVTASSGGVVASARVTVAPASVTGTQGSGSSVP